MKILFLENHLNIRGTSVALYDYAHFNETLLNNESIIVTRPYHMVTHSPDVKKDVYDKFEKRFKVLYYQHPQDIQSIIDVEKPDWLYVIKAGDKSDGLVGFKNVKMFVHSVFTTHAPHGDVYSPISEWLNIIGKTDIPVLPHIITLPETSEDLREKLGIPKDAIVFGRYGGLNEFSIPCAIQAVDEFSKSHPNVYFLFAHTQNHWSSRKNIIMYPSIIDPLEKTKFINTCNAMLYARHGGESFGIAIGEFSIRNKPIFATTINPDGTEMPHLMHKRILQDNAYWYTNKNDLLQMLETFCTKEEQEKIRGKDWNMYKQYSPEIVMETFITLIGQPKCTPKIKIGFFVIHNPDLKDRENAIKTIEDCIHIEPTIIWEKPYSKFTQEDHSRFSSNLTPGEKSLILNHEYALTKMIKEDYDYIYLMEDDAFVCNPDVMKQFHAFLSTHDNILDTCYIGCGCDPNYYAHIKLSEPFTLIPAKGPRCTEGMVYSRQGATFIVDCLKNTSFIIKPLDHFITSYYTDEFRSCHLHPHGVIQGNLLGLRGQFSSTIKY